MLNKKIITVASLMLASTSLLAGCSSNSKNENKASTTQSNTVKKLPVGERNARNLANILSKHPAKFRVAKEHHKLTNLTYGKYFILERPNYLIGENISIKDNNKRIAANNRSNILVKDNDTSNFIEVLSAPKDATTALEYVKKYGLNTAEQDAFYRLLTSYEGDYIQLNSKSNTAIIDAKKYFNNMKSMYLTLSNVKVIGKSGIKATKNIHYELKDNKRGVYSVSNQYQINL
ncbi:hypothetical protein [Lactobacillus sp.]|uniref:hypothetical protein n=1 Tax=Lactobacillus sp. TaxID=1591 RepID=UPI0019C05E7F|nr:hypothetical protein [Lactobacillus sp.]MBD5430495.1 hypothetical protein [Lactobacillus sp.]